MSLERTFKAKSRDQNLGSYTNINCPPPSINHSIDGLVYRKSKVDFDIEIINKTSTLPTSEDLEKVLQIDNFIVTESISIDYNQFTRLPRDETSIMNFVEPPRKVLDIVNLPQSLKTTRNFKQRLKTAPFDGSRPIFGVKDLSYFASFNNGLNIETDLFTFKILASFKEHSLSFKYENKDVIKDFKNEKFYHWDTLVKNLTQISTAKILRKYMLKQKKIKY